MATCASASSDTVPKPTLRYFAVACVAALVAACGGGGDSTGPTAASIVLVGGAQSGTVGQALSPSPRIEIRDTDGNVMAGIAFTVSVQSGGGTIAAVPSQTLSGGSTTVGTWTLGTTVGPNTLRVQSAGLTALTITVTADPGLPATASSTGGPMTASGSPGTVSPLQPSIRIADAFGNPISGRTISVAVSGGGSVTNSAPVTNSSGIAVVGTWTLGPTAGEQTVSLSAGGSAPAVVFRTTVEPGPAASATAATAATTGVGSPNSAAPFVPAIRVADAFGNSVAGVVISVVVTGGGTVGTSNPATSAAGVASVGSWTLGPTGGVTNTVTMTAPGLPPVEFTVTTTASAYSVQIRTYPGSPPLPVEVQTALTNAVNRIQQVVIGDLTDQPVNANVNGCFPGVGVLSEVIDDVVVYARMVPGQPGGTLASAGPCLVPTSMTRGFLPVLSGLDVESADLSSMIANGTLENVILHELFHALGFGVFWQPQSSWPFNFISGAGGGNPVFTGALARQAYVTAGGSAPTGVPVQAEGGAGTAGAHWRQSAFVNELMTGFVAPGARPLSAITIQSLADLGYQVSLTQAEPFAIAVGQIQAGISLFGVEVFGDARIFGVAVPLGAPRSTPKEPDLGSLARATYPRR